MKAEDVWDKEQNVQLQTFRSRGERNVQGAIIHEQINDVARAILVVLLYSWRMCERPSPTVSPSLSLRQTFGSKLWTRLSSRLYIKHSHTVPANVPRVYVALYTHPFSLPSYSARLNFARKLSAQTFLAFVPFPSCQCSILYTLYDTHSDLIRRPPFSFFLLFFPPILLNNLEIVTSRQKFLSTIKINVFILIFNFWDWN